jgi:hypothetical protein
LRKGYEYLSGIYVPSVLFIAQQYTFTTTERDKCNAVYGVAECVIYTPVF